VKIGDLGTARNINSLTMNNNTFIGTYNYMSPQIFRSESYTTKADVWSFGCVVYELVTLRRAFNGSVFEMMRQVESRLDMPHVTSDRIQVLLEK
jgi:serine/threonine protein kinase